MHAVTRAFEVLLTETSQPLPPLEIDENSVTPGVVGFVMTFVIAAFVLLLVVDMVRRVRRVRYREEVREQIAAEAAAGDGPATTSSADVPTVSPDDRR